MGSSQSTNVQQSLAVANKTVTDVVSETTTNVNTTQINTNSFTLNIDPSFVSDGKVRISVGQKIVAEQRPKVNSAVKNESELKSVLTSALQSSADSMSKSQIGALAIGLNLQQTNQTVNQAISNLVETSITNKTITNIDNILNNANNGNITLAGTMRKGIDVDSPQDIITSQITDTIMNSITQNSVATEIGNRMDAANKTAMSSKMQGLIDALSKLIGSAGLAIFLVAWGPCILITCCICACCMGKKKGGGGGESAAPAPAAPSAFGKKLKQSLKLKRSLKILKNV
jgi:hypothetical protein